MEEFGSELYVERREQRERAEHVDNEEAVPLIPNIKADQRRTIVHLEVWKSDPPDEGFRGQVPTTTDYATIAKRFGNGLYEFRAVTQDGKVLRRQQGVRISYTPTEPKPEAPPPTPAAPDLSLLRWQAEQHAADSRRIEDFGRMSVESTSAMARTQLEAQSRTHEANIQRDREYFVAQMQQQQQFFQNMMLQVQTFHNQAMERTAQQNQLVINVLQQSHERISRATDPTALLSVFQQGMMLNAGMQADDDDGDDADPQEPWVKAIESGAGIIKDFVEISKNGARASIAVPAQQPTQPTQPPQTQPTVQTQKRRKSPFTRSEIGLMLKAKRIMQQKGLDFEGTLNNALVYLVQGAPSEPEPDESDESDGDDSDGDSEEAPAADVAHA